MICGNCGFQNEPGDEFCGSCGQFLAWEGAPSTPTSGQPTRTSGQPTSTSGQPTSTSGQPTPTSGQPTSGGAPTTPSQQPGESATEAPQRVAETQAKAADQQVTPPPTQVSPPATAQVQQTWSAGSGTAGPAWNESTAVGPALGTTPRLIRCPVCGTANEPSRVFCFRCGTRLRAGSGGSHGRSRALRYIGAGVVLIVVIALLGTGFVLLGGGAAATSSPSPSSAPASLAASGSQATTTPGATASEPGATASEPSATASEPSASGNIETSSPASAAPTSAPGSITPTTGFSCADQQLAATAPGHWTLESARWGHKGKADYLALALTPGADSTDKASVAATLVAPGQVSSQFGVAPPASGDTALVLTFNDVVGFSGPFNADVGYGVLDAFNVAKGDQKLIYVVLGVTGSGCYNLSSDGWTSGSRSSTELVVEIHK